jgi:hypothetical protein
MTWWPEGMANTRQVKVESQSGGTPSLSLDHWGEQTVLAICRIPLEPRISTRSYHGSTLQLRTYPFSCWTHVGWQWLTDCLQKTNVLDWQRMRDELVLHTPHCLGRSAEPFAMRHTIQSYGLDALNWALIHQSNLHLFNASAIEQSVNQKRHITNDTVQRSHSLYPLDAEVLSNRV